MSLTLNVNGEIRRFEASLTVTGLLEVLGIGTGRVAVERNLEIVPRSLHATTALADGDRIEIVRFIGGG
jgi:thiamine biosynthesis protein ThiS